MLQRIIKKILFCFLLTIAVVASHAACALSIKEFFGIGTDKVEEKAPQEQEQKDMDSKIVAAIKSDKAPDKAPDKATAKAQLRLHDLQQILMILDAGQRRQILSDEKVFREFVQQEADNISVLMAAQENDIGKSDKARILSHRASDGILRQLYFNQLLGPIIKDYSPTEQQVQAYYDNNKEQFTITERMHVWQIFIPITADMSEKQVAALQKQAESVSTDLRKKKTDFATMANKYSGHQASRLSGGYMGLVKTLELKPEIKALLSKLKPEEISNPVKTSDGIHILRRGTVVSAQHIELTQVKPKIVELVREQLGLQNKQAILQKARRDHPVDLTDEGIEEWRLRLRTN